MGETGNGKRSLKDLGKATRRAERQKEQDRERRDGARRLRVAQQQFMNANAPLFRALARQGGGAESVIDGEDLRGLGETANHLAVALASRLRGKDAGDLDPLDIRPLRSEAASFVAARFDAGIAVDLERDAAAIARAVELADPRWDVNLFERAQVAPESSVSMTAAAVAAGLTLQAMVYDFRQDRDALVGRFTATVVEAAMSAAKEMLAPGAGPDDRRTLVQSLAKHMGSIMEACYERRAREVSAALARMNEADRVAWYATNDPVGEVMSSFKDWSRCFAGFAMAASREMTSAGRSGTVERNEP